MRHIKLCKTFFMEMNPITQPVITRACITTYTVDLITYAKVEVVEDTIDTFWDVTIYKVNPDGSTEDQDFESFEDAILAEEWAIKQL